jgi:hypothetical protein
VDANVGARYYWTLREGFCPVGCATEWTTQVKNTRWRLPAGVNCANGCVMQW